MARKRKKRLSDEAWKVKQFLKIRLVMVAALMGKTTDAEWLDLVAMVWAARMGEEIARIPDWEEKTVRFFEFWIRQRKRELPAHWELMGFISANGNVRELCNAPLNIEPVNYQPDRAHILKLKSFREEK